MHEVSYAVKINALHMRHTWIIRPTDEIAFRFDLLYVTPRFACMIVYKHRPRAAKVVSPTDQSL